MKRGDVRTGRLPKVTNKRETLAITRTISDQIVRFQPFTRCLRLSSWSTHTHGWVPPNQAIERTASFSSNERHASPAGLHMTDAFFSNSSCPVHLVFSVFPKFTSPFHGDWRGRSQKELAQRRSATLGSSCCNTAVVVPHTAKPPSPKPSVPAFLYRRRAAAGGTAPLLGHGGSAVRGTEAASRPPPFAIIACCSRPPLHLLRTEFTSAAIGRRRCYQSPPALLHTAAGLLHAIHHRRPTVLQTIVSAATYGPSGCCRPSTPGGATNRRRRCYKPPRAVLHTGRRAAAGQPPRAVLQTAAGAATCGRRRCYMRPLALLPTAVGAATYGHRAAARPPAVLQTTAGAARNRRGWCYMRVAGLLQAIGGSRG
jgi:hypothetical protein